MPGLGDIDPVAKLHGVALRTSSRIPSGEIAIFEPSEQSIDFVAEGNTRFVLGSAAKHPHHLVLGNYSVHTSMQAPRVGEQEIRQIGQRLVAEGKRSYALRQYGSARASRSLPPADGEATMAKRARCAGHEALDPFFEVIQEGLKGLVDGEHFFDTIAEDALFEFLYDFPGWPRVIQGRADLVDKFAGYGHNIRLQKSGGPVVHRSQDPRVVILEYEVHGKTVAADAAYNNAFVSIITIENKKIVHWRDYMDSLAAWLALNRRR